MTHGGDPYHVNPHDILSYKRAIVKDGSSTICPDCKRKAIVKIVEGRHCGYCQKCGEFKLKLAKK